MHGYQTFYGFDFYHDGVGHDEVKSIAAIEFESFVDNRQGQLQVEGELPQGEFVTETLRVCGFEEARPYCSMYFYGGADYGLCDFVYFHPMILSVTDFENIFNSF